MEDFGSFQLSHVASTSLTVSHVFLCESVKCCAKSIYINNSANIVLSLIRVAQSVSRYNNQLCDSA